MPIHFINVGPLSDWVKTKALDQGISDYYKKVLKLITGGIDLKGVDGYYNHNYFYVHGDTKGVGVIVCLGGVDTGDIVYKNNGGWMLPVRQQDMNYGELPKWGTVEEPMVDLGGRRLFLVNNGNVDLIYAGYYPSMGKHKEAYVVSV